MELLGMRQPPVGEPESFQKSLGIHNKRITLPFAYASAVIQRVIRVATGLALLFSSIGIDDAVVPVNTADKHEYPFMVPIFGKLDAITHLELSGTTRWNAIQICGIVLQEILLAVYI